MFPWQGRDPYLEQFMFHRFLQEHVRANNLQEAPRHAHIDEYLQCALGSPVRLSQLELPDETEFLWGSEQGKKRREEAEVLKNKGNDALKEKKYQLAEMIYKEALKLAREVSGTDELVSMLLSNMSYVSCLMKDHERALVSAAICMNVRPSWYKGPLRVMQVLESREENLKAISMGYDIVSDYEVPIDEKMKLWHRIFVIADKTPGGYKPLKDMISSIDMWTDLLRILSEENRWHIIHVLINGNEDIKPLITKYKQADVKLHGLLEKCTPQEWKDWGEELAKQFVKVGMSHQKLDVDGKYSLHAALKVGMKTGTYGLLKLLFERYIPTADRDRPDNEGNTVLHLACRETYPSKETAIRLLLDSQLNPTVKNKANELAINLLPPGDPHYNMLIKSLEKKGFDVAKLSRPANKHRDASHLTGTVQEGTTGNTRPSPATIDRISTQTMVNPNRSFDAQQWSVGDVKKWLDDKKLDFAKIILKGTGGSDLVELRMMLETAPNYFYETMTTEMELSPIQMLRFGSALRAIV